MKCMETYFALLFAILFVLPSFAPMSITCDAKYNVQYVCEYDNGENETLYTSDIQCTYKVGDTFVYGGIHVRVIGINEYWYSGLRLDTLYYTVACVGV